MYPYRRVLQPDTKMGDIMMLRLGIRPWPFAIAAVVLAAALPTGLMGADFAATIPASSWVSPVCIEGTYGFQVPTSVHASNRALHAAVQQVSSAGFYTNVPLLPGATNPVTITGGAGATITKNVAWSVLDIAGKNATDTHLTIRRNDFLALTATGAQKVAILEGSGVDLNFTGEPGKIYPVPWPVQGDYRLLATAANGDRIGEIAVTVVAIDLSKTILSNVGFANDLDIGVSPEVAAGSVFYTPADPALLTVSNVHVLNTWSRATITAQKLAPSLLIARISSPTGPVLAIQKVAAFTIDTSQLNSITTDGEGHGRGEIVVEPYVPGLSLTVTMFAHTSTFFGGAKSFTVDTSGGPTSLGEPGFFNNMVLDQAIGPCSDLHFDILVPHGETSYCISATGFQNYYRK